MTRYGGSFRTLREARIRRDVIAGELAALRMPALRLAEPEEAPTLAEAAERWRASRVDELAEEGGAERPQPSSPLLRSAPPN
jgi:hypothetical protein